MPDSLENVPEAQRDGMARAMKTLLDNPEVSRETKRLLKKVDPKLNFPELEIDDRIEKLREDLSAKDRDREEAQRKKEANASYEATRGRIVARGFKVEDVEKTMTDKGIANYDTAMEYMDHERQLAPPTPDSLSGGSMQMPAETNDIMKVGMKNYRTNAAALALNEVIRNRQRNF